jgi:hypothetical protein
MKTTKSDLNIIDDSEVENFFQLIDKLRKIQLRLSFIEKELQKCEDVLSKKIEMSFIPSSLFNLSIRVNERRYPSGKMHFIRSMGQRSGQHDHFKNF